MNEEFKLKRRFDNMMDRTQTYFERNDVADDVVREIREEVQEMKNEFHQFTQRMGIDLEA